MDNPEKLARQGTQDEETQHKTQHNTVRAGHHYAKANTNKINWNKTLLK